MHMRKKNLLLTNRSQGMKRNIWDDADSLTFSLKFLTRRKLYYEIWKFKKGQLSYKDPENK